MTRRSARASRLGACLALLLVLGAPATARAATISLGWLSFDQFIPPDPGDPTSVGTNAFNIFDATGDFAFLPEGPVTPVSFLGAILQLTPSGGAPSYVDLGTINPGPLDDGFGSPPFALQFADTLPFTSAAFTATLSTTNILLTDGSTFVASSPDLSFAFTDAANLVPNGLSPTFTGVEFLVEGDVRPASVPEPPMLLLAGSAFAFVLRSATRRAASRGRPRS